MGKVHAYSLFCRYIRRDENGKADVRGLTSTPCYRDWLKTRLSTPKDAAESFRKALTSHASGSSGMLPFTPEVEEAVLIHLRKHEAWECFKEGEKQIGIRGTTLKGYWEQINLGLRDPNPKYTQFIDVQTITPLPGQSVAAIIERKKKRILDDYDLIEEVSEQNKILKDSVVTMRSPFLRSPSQDLLIPAQPHYPDISINAEMALNLEMPLPGLDIFSHCVNEFMIQKSKTPLPSIVENKKDMEFIMADFKNILSRNRIIREKFENILRFIPKGYLHMFILTLYQHTKFGILLEDEVVDPNTPDYLFSLDFAFPSLEERYFYSDRPKGVLYGDLTNFTMIEVDEACEQIYRGSVVGYHSLDVRVHKQHAIDICVEQLTRQFLYYELWTRTVEYRCDGSVMVLLSKLVPLGTDATCIKIELQDVTDFFSHLL